MQASQIVGMILDIGFGMAALYLASKLTTRVAANEKRHDKTDVRLDNHERRITTLEAA